MYPKIGKYPNDRSLIVLSKVGLLFRLRQGSNELDRSCSRARSSPVMLSAAKHLAAGRDRPFAEFPLSEAHGLRVTRCDCSNGQGPFGPPTHPSSTCASIPRISSYCSSVTTANRSIRPLCSPL